jgi:hypothetical protein
VTPGGAAAAGSPAPATPAHLASEGEGGAEAAAGSGVKAEPAEAGAAVDTQ